MTKPATEERVAHTPRPLDETTLYAFIRQDLPPGQENIQGIHAAFHAGMHFGAKHGVVAGIPFVVVADTPTLKAVRKAQRKLEANELAHYAMVDTDVDSDVSAILTHPLDKVQKQILSEYRLRKYSPVAQAHIGNDGRGANADLAQLREQPVSNGKVSGANPEVGSTSQEKEIRTALVDALRALTSIAQVNHDLDTLAMEQFEVKYKEHPIFKNVSPAWKGVTAFRKLELVEIDKARASLSLATQVQK